MTDALVVLLGFSLAVPLAAAGFAWVVDGWVAAVRRQKERRKQ